MEMEKNMNKNVESQIMNAEERLRQAMLCSDTNELDKLLSPDLIFTNHLGQLIGKEDDLAAHKSGSLKINELITSEEHIRFLGDVVIVSVRMKINGSYEGTPTNGDLRFTRVWALSSDNEWRVIAGHSSVVV
jgi:ketosteroid isomerase-like protein